MQSPAFYAILLIQGSPQASGLRKERRALALDLFFSEYVSPLGDILLASDGTALTGLWFAGAKYAPSPRLWERSDQLPIFRQSGRWLDQYFAGAAPDVLPQIRLSGTPFRMAVWSLLLEIPYGCVTTYGAIARQLAKKRSAPAPSAQAVGGAVGHNPLSILVPCHRVVGSDGSLTGYAGGLERKAALLRLEGLLLSGGNVQLPPAGF